MAIGLAGGLGEIGRPAHALATVLSPPQRRVGARHGKQRSPRVRLRSNECSRAYPLGYLFAARSGEQDDSWIF